MIVRSSQDAFIVLRNAQSNQDLRVSGASGWFHQSLLPPQKPALTSQPGAKPSQTPTQLNAVPCTVSVLLMMERGGSSFWSSAACELNGRAMWKLKARFRLGRLDWTGALQGHRTDVPEKTNMHKE